MKTANIGCWLKYARGFSGCVLVGEKIIRHPCRQHVDNAFFNVLSALPGSIDSAHVLLRLPIAGLQVSKAFMQGYNPVMQHTLVSITDNFCSCDGVPVFIRRDMLADDIGDAVVSPGGNSRGAGQRVVFSGCQAAGFCNVMQKGCGFNFGQIVAHAVRIECLRNYDGNPANSTTVFFDMRQHVACIDKVKTGLTVRNSVSLVHIEIVSVRRRLKLYSLL